MLIQVDKLFPCEQAFQEHSIYYYYYIYIYAIITLPWPVISSNFEHDLNWKNDFDDFDELESWNDFDVAHGQKCPGHVSSWLTTGLHCSTARAWWIQAMKASPRRMACASEATAGRPANLEARDFSDFSDFSGFGMRHERS